MSELAALVARARTLRTNVGPEQLKELAELAFAIAQERTRRLGGVLTPVLARDYTELGSFERDGLAQMVDDVLKALIVLEYIDLTAS